MDFDPEESYFCDIHPKLKKELQRLAGVGPLHEREPGGAPIWFEDCDSGEDPPGEHEYSRSYQLFFVSPRGEAFTNKTEIESYAEPDEDDEAGGDDFAMVKVGGRGRTGWSVAVSLLNPFAVITLSEMSSFDDGSTSGPSIEIMDDTETGQPDVREADFRQLIGEQAFEILQELRGRISRILDKYRIAVLPEEEWRKPVPWLKADNEVFVGAAGEPVRVMDAFFFEGM